MDEYDELFEIEDQFEEQFADELEVLAQMEGESLNFMSALFGPTLEGSGRTCITQITHTHIKPQLLLWARRIKTQICPYVCM